jgi:hypothetical protein
LRVPFLAKVLVVNMVLILLAYLVYQDVAARAAYAGALGFAPSTSYSILTHSMILSGRGTVLTSSPTLDWFQLLALIAAATDGYMFWGYFKRSPIPEQPSLAAAEDTTRPAQTLLEVCLKAAEGSRT